jgi:hypothetical protein
MMILWEESVVDQPANSFINNRLVVDLNIEIENQITLREGEPEQLTGCEMGCDSIIPWIRCILPRTQRRLVGAKQNSLAEGWPPSYTDHVVLPEDGAGPARCVNAPGFLFCAAPSPNASPFSGLPPSSVGATVRAVDMQPP